MHGIQTFTAYMEPVPQNLNGMQRRAGVKTPARKSEYLTAPNFRSAFRAPKAQYISSVRKISFDIQFSAFLNCLLLFGQGQPENSVFVFRFDAVGIYTGNVKLPGI